MLEKDFLFFAEKELIKIADLIEQNDKESLFDVEYLDGILNIFVEKTNQTYVVNKHSASQKIWYSSPVTGADYFVFDEAKKQWLDDKNLELADKLFSELKNFK